VYLMKTIVFIFAVLVALSAGTATGMAQQLAAPTISQVIAQSDEALAQNDVPKALTLVRDALARHPGDEQLLLQEARIAVYQKHDKQAITLVNGVLRKNRASRDGKLTLAQIYGYRGDYRKSDSLYRELLAANPADEAAAVGLIHNLVLEDKREQARTELQKALKLNPTSLRLLEYSDYLTPAKAVAGRRETPELFHRVQVGETFFSDNAGNRALYSSQGISYELFQNFSTRFRMDESSLWKLGFQPLTVYSASEELRVRVNRYLAVRGTGGGVRFADTSTQPTYSGDLEIYPFRGLLLSGGYSRFPILPTFDAALFDTITEGWHARTDYRAHGFSLHGSAYFTHYTDGNKAERESAELMKWFGSGVFSAGSGVAVRHIHFQQQLANGYFSPSQYWSHLGEIGFRVRAGRVYRGEFIGYLGAERQDPTTYVGAGELQLNNEFYIRRWELELNYSHFHLAQASGAFHADMFSGALGFRF
jgi:tetratricopeptide (TPR) repeat protein